MTRSFVWTPQKERALALVDEGRLSQREIALELRTTRRTVEGWIRRPAFHERLQLLTQARKARRDAEWEAQLAAIRAESEHAAAQMRASLEMDTARWLESRQAAWQARRQHRKLPEGAERCGR